MSRQALITTHALAEHLDDAQWVVVDCRFSLDDEQRGHNDHLAAHIPGALYAHLGTDLSSPVVPGETGRHPLPSVDVAARTFSNWGIDRNVQVVCYDDATGMIASRLWWMLRWLGHDKVAVLDGGWAEWLRGGGATHSGVETRPARTFVSRPQPNLVATTADVDSRRDDPRWRLVDARIGSRFRGEYEPIDPVAGRIPGAVNCPHPDNVDANGLSLSPSVLRDRFEGVLGDVPPERAIFYCGSGVTATRNLLALAHAGLGDAQLYAGSWSEWILDPSRPVATG